MPLPIVVCPVEGPGCDATSLVQALDLVADGGVIEFTEGRYDTLGPEVFVDVTLRGRAGEDVTLFTTWEETLSFTPGTSVVLEDLTIESGPYFEAIYVDEATLLARRLTLPGAEHATQTVGLVVEGGVVTVEDSTFSGHRVIAPGLDHQGAAIAVDGGSLKLTRVTIEDCFGAHVGALGAVESTVTVVDSLFQRNVSAIDGGAMHLNATATTVLGSHFLLNEAWGDGGGALSVLDGSVVTVGDSVFEGNSGWHGGAILAALPPDGFEPVGLELRGTSFVGNAASIHGGAIKAEGGHVVDVEASRFTGNTAEHGGAIIVFDGVDLDVGTTGFCDNAAIQDSGAIDLGSATARVWNSWFGENQASSNGGAIGAWEVELGLDHVALLGNRSAEGGGLFISGGFLALTNSLIAYTTSGDGAQGTGDAIAAVHDAFWENTDVHVRIDGVEAFPEGDGNFARPPDLAVWTPGDARCEPEVFRLGADSPLRDAGTGLDADGSTADVGPLGGPDAPVIDTGDADTDTDSDSDTDTDTDSDTDPLDDTDLDPADWWLSGGGCATAPGPGGLGLIGVLLLRRRRR